MIRNKMEIFQIFALFTVLAVPMEFKDTVSDSSTTNQGKNSLLFCGNFKLFSVLLFILSLLGIYPSQILGTLKFYSKKVTSAFK